MPINPLHAQVAVTRRRNDLGPRRAGSSPAAATSGVAPAAPSSPLETPRAGFFYPRIIYGGGAQLDFLVPADPLISEGVIKGENISLPGFQETLWVRHEPRLTLGFRILSETNLIQIREWWREWGSRGRQNEVILDRFDTCTGQYEYDIHNRTFTRAHCLYNPFEPRRFTPSRALYTLQLTFRQGQDESVS
jgi:hypothetical protein